MQTRCNLELEEGRLGERLEFEVRVLARQVLTDSWQGLYFPSSAPRPTIDGMGSNADNNVSDEIYPAGKLTPYAMAARAPGMAQPVSEQHDLEAVEIAEAVVRWAEERIWSQRM